MSNPLEKYEIIKEVGQGSFGVVWRARNMHTRELVAIKKIKIGYYTFEECLNLQEIKSLKKLVHPNIIKLKEVVKENNFLYLVFENMESSLLGRINAQMKPFSDTQIRNWCFQVFQGLAYVHGQGYIHCDLKPENLLVSGDKIKICDFGSAHETSDELDTDYITTRWYRAPEVLLRGRRYGPEIDMWAMGAIMAEMFTLQPLFPGSNEVDQIYKICEVIGSPTKKMWPMGISLANDMKFVFPWVDGGEGLCRLMPNVNSDAVDLIRWLCSWDPCRRPTATEALQHPFFWRYDCIPLSMRGL